MTAEEKDFYKTLDFRTANACYELVKKKHNDHCNMLTKLNRSSVTKRELYALNRKEVVLDECQRELLIMSGQILEAKRNI